MLIYQPDNRRVIKIVVEAMVGGAVKEFARGTFSGEIWTDTETLTCELPGFGSIKAEVRVVKQNVLDMLKMSDYGKAICGVDISCGIGGAHDTIDKTSAVFHDIGINIRANDDTIVASGKIGPKRSGIFLPLDSMSIAELKSGNYKIQLQIGEKEPMALPLHPGIVCTAIPAGIEPSTRVLLTCSVKYSPDRWGGVVHSVYTFLKRDGGNKEVHLKDLKKAPLTTLLRSVVMHMQKEGGPESDLRRGNT